MLKNLFCIGLLWLVVFFAPYIYVTYFSTYSGTRVFETPFGWQEVGACPSGMYPYHKEYRGHEDNGAWLAISGCFVEKPVDGETL